MAGNAPKKHPTVGPQAVINNVAMSLVSGWFSHGWILQLQEPNYHEDYVIERVDAGELSGAKIAAQLKGHATVKFKDGSWSEVMETKHLRYYAEKVRMPVFLFIADTTKHRGHYLFLQQWLDANTTSDQLVKQKKVSVRVPFANDLEDQPQFAAAVEAALAYMAKRNPGTVEDAIASESGKIAAIDPRWDVRLDVVNGAKNFTLQPKQDVTAKLSVKAESVEKLRELVEWGKNISLSGSEVSIDGLPLYDYLSRKFGGVASVSLKKNLAPVSMHLWSEGPNGFRLTLPGSITAGSSGVSFVASLPDAPIRAEMKAPREAINTPGTPVKFSVSFDFSKWSGRPLGSLPYYDAIRGLATAILEDRRINHELIEAGNRVSGGHFGSPLEALPFAYAAAVVSNVEKARQISRLSKLEICMPDVATLTADDVEAVESAHALLSGGQLQFPRIEFSMNIGLPETSSPADAVRELEALGTSAEPFSFHRVEQSANVYGVEVPLGDLVYTVRPVAVRIDEPGRSEFMAGRIKTINADILGVPSSTLTVQQSIK